MNALLDTTKHVIIRMAQRNISADDLGLAMQIGTEVDDGFLVREKDVQSYVRVLKHQIERAEKLIGTRIVNDGDSVITVYRAGKRKQRRLLRDMVTHSD
jgi:hypothetical protein